MRFRYLSLSSDVAAQKERNDMRRGSSVSAVSVIENSPAKLNVTIIHSMPLMRLGLEAALLKSPSFSRSDIRNFASLSEAAEALAGFGSSDLVLLDMAAWSTLERPANAPQMSALKARGAALGLIASADQDAARLLAARGISGVISPDADPEHVIAAAEDLAAGRTCFPVSKMPPAASARLARLSSRQFEILELMTNGLLNKQIAWQLGLTEGTVKSHVSAILEKLGCDRRTQAIMAFMQCFGAGGNRAAVA
ncbi:MAG: DNA-binding response regulator [Beijerinckiaceae bacterium]